MSADIPGPTADSPSGDTQESIDALVAACYAKQPGSGLGTDLWAITSSLLTMSQVAIWNLRRRIRR